MHGRIFTLLAFLFVLAGCENSPSSSSTLKVGTLAGPQARLLEVAKNVAWREAKLDVQIVEYSDPETPNVLVSQGSLDANLYQSTAHLDQCNQAHHHGLTAIAKMFKMNNEIVVLASRLQNKNDPRLLPLIAALHSPDVIQTAQKLFKGEAVKAW